MDVMRLGDTEEYARFIVDLVCAGTDIPNPYEYLGEGYRIKFMYFPSSFDPGVVGQGYSRDNGDFFIAAWILTSRDTPVFKAHSRVIKKGGENASEKVERLLRHIHKAFHLEGVRLGKRRWFPPEVKMWD